MFMSKFVQGCVAEHVQPTRPARQIVAEAGEADHFDEPETRGFGFQFGAQRISEYSGDQSDFYGIRDRRCVKTGLGYMR